MPLLIPATAVALKLHRLQGEVLLACEAVEFNDGASAIITILNRAVISGRVEVGGKIQSHFADVLDKAGDILETVALDADSYRVLKSKWMRCRLESE